MVSENKPTISVVMSVYNGQIYLPTAIESILSQTFADFEFIIVDDGSIDNSLDIIREYSVKDGRISIVINMENIGLAMSLNKGINLAQGKYIARMDADDISVSDRFAKQTAFLENNTKVFALGGSVIYMDEGGKLGKLGAYPLRPEQIKWYRYFGNPLAHPTVMFRKELFSEHGIHYDETLETTQDFNLWVQISQNFQIANLPDVLIYYRQHEQAVSQVMPLVQSQNNFLIRKDLFDKALKWKFRDDVINGTKKPFPARKISTVLQSILLILLLKKKFHLHSLEKTDQEFIRHDVQFRIRKIIQNSGFKSLQFFNKVHSLFQSVFSPPIFPRK